MEIIYKDGKISLIPFKTIPEREKVAAIIAKSEELLAHFYLEKNNTYITLEAIMEHLERREWKHIEQSSPKTR